MLRGPPTTDVPRRLRSSAKGLHPRGGSERHPPLSGFQRGSAGFPRLFLRSLLPKPTAGLDSSPAVTPYS